MPVTMAKLVDFSSSLEGKTKMQSITQALVTLPPDAYIRTERSTSTMPAIEIIVPAYGTMLTMYTYLRERASLRTDLTFFIEGGGYISDALNVDIATYETVEDLITAVVQRFVDKCQKPASQGSIKAYHNRYKLTWAWKRPSSPSIALHEGEYYLWQSDGRFVKVHRTVTDSDIVVLTDELRLRMTRIGSQYWYNDVLIPIYVNTAPYTAVARRVQPGQETRYHTILLNGTPVHVDSEITLPGVLGRPLHSYSNKIEQLVSEDKLFLKGKSDLYANRPKDETPFLGWELEACCDKSLVGIDETALTFKKFMLEQVMTKPDGSISPLGFETVSVPATLDFWKESDLSSVLDTMRSQPYNMRSSGNSTTGVHVHVSRSALSVLDLQKLERFMHNPDNKEFLTAVAGRSPNTYQNYNPKLFNDRKSLSAYRDAPSSARGRHEGISYFANYTPEMLYTATEGWLGRQRTALNIPARFSSFTNAVFTNYVSFSSVSRACMNWSRIHADRYGVSVNDQIVSCFASPVGSYFSTEEAYITALKIFTEDLVRHCPRLAKTFVLLFPELGLTVVETEVPVEEVPTNALAGVRKSTLPAGRKNSYKASQGTKGPVGKGTIGRYDVLNTLNQHTVEFRLFNGTLNPNSFMRYLEFVDAIVRFVAATSASNDGLHHQTFVKWLVGDTFNIIRYEHLMSFIIDKGFLDRSKVRRKELPKDDNTDNNVTHIKPLDPPKIGAEAVPPLGTWISSPDAPALASDPFSTSAPAAPPPISFVDDPDEYEGDDYDPEPDWDDEPTESAPGCNCSDCVELRGYEV